MPTSTRPNSIWRHRKWRRNPDFIANERDAVITIERGGQHPEIDFSGKQYRKIRFAVMSSAGLRGGLDPDLLDEVSYWIDDYWRYALYAAIALIRASAAKTGQSVPDLADQLAKFHNLDLSRQPADSDPTP